jgi:DNA-binding protein H-NS
MKRDVSNLLSALSVDQLLALQVRLTELVAQRTQEQIAAVFNEFASRAGLRGSRAAAAPAAARGRKAGRKSLKGSKVPAKYRDPANADNTWTGRGVPPRWMQAYLDAGHQRDEYLIAGKGTATAKQAGKRGGKKKAVRKSK